MSPLLATEGFYKKGWISSKPSTFYIFAKVQLLIDAETGSA
jgi:hypothetical protein